MTKIEPLLQDASSLSHASDDIWTSLEYDDPEARIDQWIDIEPTLMAVIEFSPLSEQGGVDITAISESTQSVSSIIIKATAGALLRGGLSNHFHYRESGELVINTQNPPSLEQAYEILGRTLEIKATGQKIDNYSAWTIGMLGDELERYYEGRFDPSVVMAQTGKAYNTYITSLGVYRACWANRRQNLSFTHHKEAYYAKIAPELKEKALDICSRHNLSVGQLRKILSHMRVYGEESLDEMETAESADDVLDRLSVRTVSKNYLFFLPSRNKWFQYRGPYEMIPNGATPILNADTRAIIREGESTPLESYSPPGVEMPALRGHAAAIETEAAEAALTDAPVSRSRGGRTETRHPVGEDAVMPPLTDLNIQSLVDLDISTEDILDGMVDVLEPIPQFQYPFDPPIREAEFNQALEALQDLVETMDDQIQEDQDDDPAF